MTDETRREDDEKREEETLLGDADELKHPSIEEQVDEKLQREKEREEDE